MSLVLRTLKFPALYLGLVMIAFQLSMDCKMFRHMDITCGPGHGISIGSLRSGNSEAHVSGVTVNRANFSGTTNGVRIKTWQGGSESASNIKFQNIEMHDVSNPIIIEQNYCDQDEPCKQQKSAVQVRNVTYQNIRGTSASDVVVEFDCSVSLPCEAIVLQNINLQKPGGGSATASCNNIDPEQNWARFALLLLNGSASVVFRLSSLVIIRWCK